MKNPENTLAMDMRCEKEGRCIVQLDIDFLTHGERSWLFALLQAAQQGREMNFGANTLPTGDVVLQFHLAAPAADHDEPTELPTAHATH